MEYDIENPNLMPMVDEVERREEALQEEQRAIEVDALAAQYRAEEAEQGTSDLTPQAGLPEGGATPRQQQQPEEEKEEPKEEKKEEEGGWAQGLVDYSRQSIQQAAGMDNTRQAAILGTLVDFPTDLVNKIPGVNLPKLPPYDNKINQTVREMSSLIGPMILLRRAVNPGIVGAQKATQGTRIAKLGEQKAFQWFSEWGLDLGLGAFVDWNVKFNEEDDTALTALKERFPNTFSWIPRSWVNKDDDSPDTKRKRNILEGVGLGTLGHVVSGLAWIGKQSGAIDRATKWIPKNEEAAEYFDSVKKSQEEQPVRVQQLEKVDDEIEAAIKSDMDEKEFDALSKELEKKRRDIMSEFDAADLAAYARGVPPRAPLSDDPFEQTVLQGEIQEMDNLDELGAYQLQTEIDLDQPIKGVSDTFSLPESGIRTADVDGLAGVTVDAARIAKNIDTSNGRLGSIFTEAALKEGLDPSNISKRTLVRRLVSEIKSMGEYDAITANGKNIKWKDINAAGDRLAEMMFDPVMEPGMLKAVLDEFKDFAKGISYINDVGYDAAFKAINKYLNEFFNLDVKKAEAYLANSIAGQVSDLAEGSRYMEGTAAIEAAQEQIFDRLKYLMVEKGLSSWQRGSGLANINVWKRIKVLNDPKALEFMAQKAEESHYLKRGQIIKDVEQTIGTLKEVAKEKPHFWEPLNLAYEFSDGNINSMHQLNKVVRESLGVWNKAFVDGAPEMPSVVTNAAWSNYFNSILSGTATFLRAGVGNAGGLFGKFASHMVGAVAGGDMKTMKLGWYKYNAIMDSTEKGLTHWKKVFQKAATDPAQVQYITRSDIRALRDEQKMEMLKGFADAAAKDGNYGPQLMLDRALDMQAMADSPWFRYGGNMMTATDGFTRAVVNNWNMRERAYLDLTNEGRKFTKKDIDKIADRMYKESFDEKGLIQDMEADYTSREIALNLDNAGVEGLNAIIKRVPALRFFVMFPRTVINMGQTFHRWGPTNMLVGDYQKIVRPKLQEFSVQDMADILRTKNIPVDKHIEQRFKTLRAEIRGKVAIGTFMTGVAASMAMNDRLHGNGIYDMAQQKARGKNWMRRAFKGTDGRWHSADFLGPVGDWMFFVADMVDNFDRLSEATMEKFAAKAALTIAATLEGKTTLSQLEPMMDVFQGNPTAANRWAASVINGAFPWAGPRNDIGKLLSPELKLLDMDIMSEVLKRNRGIAPDLPVEYDWIDGKMTDPAQGDWLTRAVNAFTPFRTAPGMTPRKQFLLDIEYDGRPVLNKSPEGVEYTQEQKAYILQGVGKEGYFGRELDRIMKDVEEFGFIKNLKEARAKGLTSKQYDIDKLMKIHVRIDSALKVAVRRAEKNLPDEDFLRRQEQAKRSNEYNTLRGEAENIITNVPY